MGVRIHCSGFVLYWLGTEPGADEIVDKLSTWREHDPSFGGTWKAAG
ncbi:hypothetical protein [Kibdelosporangium phytohabitans]|nr:hypothetical protein [Kibdelosporangium phytohabitans]MBE1468562.1 hypothetical protein [Kibdelosporangium phytohabitans]